MELKDIKFDKRNYRKHSDKNKSLIKKSIEETGLGRSVVIDSENSLIAGNGVVSQLPKDTKIRVIETDGSELVVVKRTDLKTEDEKRKKLAIMDNSTGDLVEWDYTLLQEDFDVEQLADFGAPVFEASDLSDIDDFFKQADGKKEKMPKKVVCPHCGKEFDLEQ